MEDQSRRYVVSLLIRDRVGVLCGISSAITDLGGNIDGISQTVVVGYFTVTLTATFPSRLEADVIRAKIAGNFESGEASIAVRDYTQAPAQKAPDASDTYIATVTGLDRAGILKAVTSFFAAKGINIEDWYVQFDLPQVVHIGEIRIPRIMDIKQIQDEFRQLLTPMGLVTGIQHINIFRATSEIGPIKTLLGGSPSC